MIMLSGFSFDGTRGHIGFAPRLQDGGVFRSFWSGANAYGTVEFANGNVRVDVLGGDLVLKSLGLPEDSGAADGARFNSSPIAVEAGTAEVRFTGLRLGAGDRVDVSVPGLNLLALPELATL